MRVGKLAPRDGAELINQELSEALTQGDQLIEFAEEAWEAFGVEDLSLSRYVQGADGSYFQPVETATLGNFFRDGGLPACEEVTVESVDAKAREHLERKQGDGKLNVKVRTPRGVLSELCTRQGGFVEGERESALDRIACQIQQMVKDVSAGKVIAEAQGLQDGQQTSRRAPVRNLAVSSVHSRVSDRSLCRSERSSVGRISARDDLSSARGSSCGPSEKEASHEPGALVFSPGLAVDRESTPTLNPILLHKAAEAEKDREKSKVAARAQLQAGDKMGLLRHLMPDQTKQVVLEDHVLLDRYLEASQVAPPTKNRGLLATKQGTSAVGMAQLEMKRRLNEAGEEVKAARVGRQIGQLQCMRNSRRGDIRSERSENHSSDASSSGDNAGHCHGSGRCYASGRASCREASDRLRVSAAADVESAEAPRVRPESGQTATGVWGHMKSAAQGVAQQLRPTQWQAGRAPRAVVVESDLSFSPSVPASGALLGRKI